MALEVELWVCAFHWVKDTEVEWMAYELWVKQTHFKPYLCHLLVNYSTSLRLTFLNYKMRQYQLPISLGVRLT